MLLCLRMHDVCVGYDILMRYFADGSEYVEWVMSGFLLNWWTVLTLELEGSLGRVTMEIMLAYVLFLWNQQQTAD